MLLGETLARQEGQALLDLVEEVRALVRSDGAAAARRLAEVDIATATLLARAFSTYFHLANITEQVHRARGLRRKRVAEGGWLDHAAQLIQERGVPAAEVAAAAVAPRGPAGVHRPSDRGGAPVDPGQVAGGRRRSRRPGRTCGAGRRGRGRVGRGRPATGRTHRHVVADGRAAAHPT